MTALRPVVRSVPSIARIPHRSVLSIVGPDATTFLNGVLACAVPKPPRGPFYSALLHAQGRVLHDLFVYPYHTENESIGYNVEYDSRTSTSEGPNLLQLLKRYVLRSKVKIREATDQWNVWAAWSLVTDQGWGVDRIQWQKASSGVLEPIWMGPADDWPWGKIGNVTSQLRLRDRRAVGMGLRMLVRTGDKPPEAATFEERSPEDYVRHRYLHGVPEGSVEIPPLQIFPMDANLDVMGGVDFRKGCYVGQELTVRTYHTGVVRKRTLPVLLSHSADLHNSFPSGARPSFDSHPNIRVVRNSSRDGPRPRNVGKLLGAVEDVGLALMRTEFLDQVETGLLLLELDQPTGEPCRLSHWWPDWARLSSEAHQQDNPTTGTQRSHADIPDSHLS